MKSQWAPLASSPLAHNFIIQSVHQDQGPLCERATHIGNQGTIRKVATISPIAQCMFMGECGPQLFLDDLLLNQDFIHSKAAPLLQSIESQPSTQGLFVCFSQEKREIWKLSTLWLICPLFSITGQGLSRKHSLRLILSYYAFYTLKKGWGKKPAKFFVLDKTSCDPTHRDPSFFYYLDPRICSIVYFSSSPHFLPGVSTGLQPPGLQVQMVDTSFSNLTWGSHKVVIIVPRKAKPFLRVVAFIVLTLLLILEFFVVCFFSPAGSTCFPH